MRISDWSSDVCSSDLAAGVVAVAQRRVVTIACGPLPVAGDRRVFLLPRGRLLAFASCGLLRLPGFLRLGRQARFTLLALALQQPLEVVALLARRRLARAGFGLGAAVVPGGVRLGGLLAAFDKWEDLRVGNAS